MARIFLDFLSEPEFRISEDSSSYAESITLSPELSHHLKNVLRLDQGKQLNVVSKLSGVEYLAVISAISAFNDLIEIQLLRPLEKQVLRPIVSSLICALPKGSHSDQICEQVSQLGIKDLVFWCAERSVAQPKQAQTRLSRWQKIAEAAARQSKQNQIPRVAFLNSSNELSSYIKTNINSAVDSLAICSLQSKSRPIAEIVKPEGAAHLIIGPEGDFSPREFELLDNLGAQHLSLGPLVLRVETAAVVSVAMGLAAWGWR